MPTYYANDLIFDIPDTLKDQTTHILTVNEDGPSPFNITIARKTIAPDETVIPHPIVTIAYFAIGPNHGIPRSS